MKMQSRHRDLPAGPYFNTHTHTHTHTHTCSCVCFPQAESCRNQYMWAPCSSEFLKTVMKGYLVCVCAILFVPVLPSIWIVQELVCLLPTYVGLSSLHSTRNAVLLQLLLRRCISNRRRWWWRRHSKCPRSRRNCFFFTVSHAREETLPLLRITRENTGHSRCDNAFHGSAGRCLGYPIAHAHCVETFITKRIHTCLIHLGTRMEMEMVMVSDSDYHTCLSMSPISQTPAAFAMAMICSVGNGSSFWSSNNVKGIEGMELLISERTVVLLLASFTLEAILQQWVISKQIIWWWGWRWVWGWTLLVLINTPYQFLNPSFIFPAWAFQFQKEIRWIPRYDSNDIS